MPQSPIFSNLDNAMQEHKRAIAQQRVINWIARKKACVVLTQMLGDDIEQ